MQGLFKKGFIFPEDKPGKIISQESKNLISKMLVEDPKLRI